jgi:hypothetical protein
MDQQSRREGRRIYRQLGREGGGGEKKSFLDGGRQSKARNGGRQQKFELARMFGILVQNLSREVA